MKIDPYIRPASSWRRELVAEMDAALGVDDPGEVSRAIDRVLGRAISSARLDEAMACLRLVTPDGNPQLAIERIGRRADVHRMHATKPRRRRVAP